MCNHEWEAGEFGSVCKLCKRTAADCFDPTYASLSIQFDTVEDARIFKAWLSDGGGEQNLNAGDEQFTFDYHQGTMVVVHRDED